MINIYLSFKSSCKLFSRHSIKQVELDISPFSLLCLRCDKLCVSNTLLRVLFALFATIMVKVHVKQVIWPTFPERYAVIGGCFSEVQLSLARNHHPGPRLIYSEEERQPKLRLILLAILGLLQPPLPVFSLCWKI